MAKMSQNPYPFLTMIIMDLAGLSHVNLIRLSYKIILCHLKILFLKWAGVRGGGGGGGGWGVLEFLEIVGLTKMRVVFELRGRVLTPL